MGACRAWLLLIERVGRRRECGRYRNAGGSKVNQRLPLRVLIPRDAGLLQASCPWCERRNAALLVKFKLQLNLEQRTLVLDAHETAAWQDRRTAREDLSCDCHVSPQGPSYTYLPPPPASVYITANGRYSMRFALMDALLPSKPGAEQRT